MTPKKKECRQRGVCKWYEECRYEHDATRCRTADTDPDGDLVLEVE